MIWRRMTSRRSVLILCLVFGITYLLSYQPFPYKTVMKRVLPTLGSDKITQCEPKRHFVFAKIPKTGSTTLTCILLSYAIKNKLNLMLPQEELYNLDITSCKGLGWEVGPNASAEPDALISHAVYRQNVTEKLFPKDSVYLATIRHPIDHFVSRVYFSIDHGLGERPDWPKPITPELIISNSTYAYVGGLARVLKVEKHYHLQQLQYLGFNYTDRDSISAVTEYIDLLEQRFPFMIVNEYYDEGLVLLKRRMCWTLKDILYKQMVVGSYDRKASYPVDFQDKVLKFNYPELLLYERFNNSFWEQVKRELLFTSEVTFFKTLNVKVSNFCFNRVAQNMSVEDADWGTFYFTKEICRTSCIGNPDIRSYSKVGLLDTEVIKERTLNGFCNQSKS